ncbi:uncharacterized protein LOC126627283 [Malus sylvestris]|uniref:uncharacterized protein LOC126627283 n=1 Tax=Malus sylvestris TaxID=3752 RepID=UPI0010A9A8E4|nr:uncharacterized protein LOC114825368 [Malus domestica]XP_050152711.1 uncharacterized protein LOC126627283 [Malus sylvestris]
MMERAEKLRFCPYEVPRTCKSEENNKINPPDLPAPRAQRSSSFPQTCNHRSGLHLRKKKIHICGLHETKERMSSRRYKGKDVLSEITDLSKHKDTRIHCTAER